MKERQLQVLLGVDRVGNLIEEGGAWHFTYDAAWRARPDAIALSPHLPLAETVAKDGSTQRPVQWFFDNLLPEETLRARLAREARVAEADAFGLLEAYGGESAGALTLLPPGAAPGSASLVPLDDGQLLERIRNLPRETLAARAPRKMSLPGAQHKLAVVIADGRLFEPLGAAASTHILKPNHPDAGAYPHSAVNEWFTMALARAAGLDVPGVSHRYVPVPEAAGGHEAIYVVARFDRVRERENVRRLHAIDGCQALNLVREYKYASMSIDSLLTIADITRSRAATRMKLFRWAVFNVMVANADAHLKNLSFLVSPQGCELAPHYDLVSTGCFDAGADPVKWGDVRMSLALPGAATFGEVTYDSLIALGEALRLRPQVASRTVETMRTKVASAADALIAQYEALPYPQSAAVLRGGESRVLRQIRHVVIDEMVRRLGAPAGTNA